MEGLLLFGLCFVDFEEIEDDSKYLIGGMREEEVDLLCELIPFIEFELHVFCGQSDFWIVVVIEEECEGVVCDFFEILLLLGLEEAMELLECEIDQMILC